MNSWIKLLGSLFFGGLLTMATVALAATNPFLGYWELTIPGGAAGWLGVEEQTGQLKGSILWGGGSVLPLDGMKVEADSLVLTRIHKDQKMKTTETETITAKLSGDSLNLVTVKSKGDGKEYGRAEFSGKRQPPLPPAPDLTKVKFGTPIVLFGGKDLSGWRLLSPKAANGWSVKDGILSNNPVQEKGQPHKNYSNLRTEKEFEDFNLTLEVRCAPESNSGVYLRGIYEVQVFDSFGKPLDPHNMGAIYTRICPTVAAEKPAGQWQTMDITMVDRHVTIMLNGKNIIDNQPLLGCTGGALWSDVSKPGPIYLQGDHSSIEYRDIVLRPVVK